MTDNTAYTYSFGCPQCGGSWKFEEFASIAKDVFSSFEGMGVCPLCGVTFSWLKPGTMKVTAAPDWWKGVWAESKTHYKPHRCAFFGCNKVIEGSEERLYCSRQCRQNAYYHRKHPNSTLYNVEKIKSRS